MTADVSWRFVALSFLVPAVAHAAETSTCEGPLDVARAVRCALDRSPEVLAARRELAALDGRRTVAATVLPSHPEISGTIARRTRSGASANNWSVTLSQEVEIPGKRATRLAEVDAERMAALRRVTVAERDAAAETLLALYAVAAGDEALALATDLERGAERLATAMAARAAEGLVPAIEADLAAAEGLRLSTSRLDVDGRRAAARAHLALLIGAPPPVLDPDVLATPGAGSPNLPALVQRALSLRADLAAAAAERQVASARVDRVRRQRLPNPVFSLFAQRDGFDERVLGAGLTIPLVLPAPLGPSGSGEVREAEARRSQVEAQLAGVRRQVEDEVTGAFSRWQARRRALDRYPAPIVGRARQHLVSLSDAIRNRQLAPREALLAQRTFIELLQTHLETRLAEAVARIELLRAAALPLPGVAP